MITRRQAGGKSRASAPALTQANEVESMAQATVENSTREHDERTDYGFLETRQLLIEFIGGEPGEQMRDQFR